jgi:hypothetical protein
VAVVASVAVGAAGSITVVDVSVVALVSVMVASVAVVSTGAVDTAAGSPVVVSSTFSAPRSVHAMLPTTNTAIAAYCESFFMVSISLV